MRHAKLIVGCLATAGALMTALPSGASAAAWFVNGSMLSKSTEVSPTTRTVKNIVISGDGETVECTGLTGKEISIQEPSIGTAKALKLTGCSSTTAGCTISSSEITTSIVTFETSAIAGTETKMLIEPFQVEHILAKIKFEVGCPLSGNLPLKGEHLTTTSPKGSTEATEQEFIMSSSTELKLGAGAATVKGAALLKLTSGLKWSFH
jgi:hypothetical protein